MVDALRWAAAERPVVLVLEDLHWAGAAARDLLHVLVTAPEEQQLLVLATTRNAVPDRSLGLSRMTSELLRRDDVHRLDLPGLDTEEIVDYLRRNRIAEIPEVRRVAAMLRDATGGNPFLLRELCRDLDPLEGLGDREWRFSAPGAYALSVAERLEAMPRTEREVLRLAAVMGEEFDVGEVTDAATRLLDEALTRETLLGLSAAPRPAVCWTPRPAIRCPRAFPTPWLARRWSPRSATWSWPTPTLPSPSRWRRATRRPSDGPYDWPHTSRALRCSATSRPPPII